MIKSSKPLRIHFMGIGGSGISAVARIAKSLGFIVSGCDLEENRATRDLRREGIDVQIGHDASHLKNIDLLIHTPAVFYQSVTHSEYVSADKKKIALIWEAFMAKYLQQGKKVIAVSGTHGKGTTAAMLGIILEEAGLDPTCEIGANLLDWNKRNFRIGQGDYFLCEADEFREKFLLYKPGILIITSVEMDHPEYFTNLGQIVDAFKKLVLQMSEPKVLVINDEDKGCRSLISKLKAAKWSGKIIKYQGLGKNDAKLKLPGKHIRSDAAGAAAAAKSIGVNRESIKKGLESFSGLERRFEYRGEIEGVKIYDDYAHHPTAVAVNITAAREFFPSKKLWAVFQPHMYARLQALFDDFQKSLSSADRVIVTDVFTRREHNITKPSGKDLALAIGGPKATYVGGDLLNVANFVSRNTSKGDIVLVMGAGDIYKVSDILIEGKKN